MDMFKRKRKSKCCSSKQPNFLVEDITKISIIKSLYYNFRYLPFQKAIKFPILIGTKTKIRKFGIINLPDKDNCFFGMLSIGVHVIDAWEKNVDYTVISNYGVINIIGQTRLNWGCKLFIKEGAVVSFGNRVRIGCRSRIICYKSISFGDDVRCSWENQIFDTDFHFLHNLENGKYYSRVKPIIIGSNVFVGNRCTIAKGTIIPNGCVISCCSKVRGDFSEEGNHFLLMGNPAKVVKSNVEMSNSWFHEDEKIALLMNE